jgi:hypothetical protein
VTAAVVVAAVLAALAVTKTFERHLPRIVVRAGIAVFVVGSTRSTGASQRRQSAHIE